jgi:carboxypeptidase PM20D1
MVATRVAGGVADNVVAPIATATVNVRMRPGHQSEEVVARIRRAVGDPAVRIAVVGPVTEASAVTSPQGAGFVTVEGILRRLAPLREAGVIVAPTLTLASTDARWFADQAASVLRFVPVQASGSQLAGIHGVDERVAVGDLQLAVTFYRALLLALPSLD